MKRDLRKCDSAAMLSNEVESIRDAILQPETEESWDAIAAALTTLTYLFENGGGDYPSQLIAAAKSFYRPINSSMNSERSRLSGAAIDLVAALATTLESAFDQLLNLFFPTLLALCARSNKVLLSRARACITTIIECAQPPAVFAHLLPALKDKSGTLRIAAVEAILTCMNCFNPPELEKEARARDVEAAIRTTARDANPDVRKTSRKIFEAYRILLPSRVDRFTEPLSPTMKKYLDIKPKSQSSISSNAVPRLKTGFPSLPDLKGKAKLSSSTSVLPQTTSSNMISTASDHGPTHIRSASAASALPSAATTSSSNDLGLTSNPTRSTRQPSSRTQDKEKEPATGTTGKSTKVPGSMPPPDYIPVRPNQSKQPTPAIRVPMNLDDPRMRHTGTLSGQPMRVMLPPGAVAGSARRVITSSSTTRTASVNTGPKRPNRPVTIPTMMTAEGLMRPILPIRSASADETPSDVVVVGARRVPMPEPGTEGETRRGGRSTSRSDNGAKRELSAASRSGREGVQRATVVSGPTRTMVPARGGERGKGVSKPATSQERVNGAKPQISNEAGESGGASAKAEIVNAGPRGKDGGESKAGGGSSKPGWGRPTSRKVISAGNVGKEKDKERGEEKEKALERKRSRSQQQQQQQQQQRQPTKPEMISLPPSPGRSTRTPTPVPGQVSLPESPSGKAQEPIVDLNDTEGAEPRNDAENGRETSAPVPEVEPAPPALASEHPQDPVDPPTSPPPPQADSTVATPPPPVLPTKVDERPITPSPGQPFSTFSTNENTSTPISNLLESIQRGFLMTPSSPLSPPQAHLARAAAAAGLPAGAPMKFTMPALMREVSGLQFGLGKPNNVGVVGGTGEEGTRVALTDVGVNQ